MKQFLSILIAVVCFVAVCPRSASAQGAQRISVALGNVAGVARILAYAQVKVCAYQSVHPQDCTTGITLYTNPALTVPYPSNPIQADQNGNYSYFIVPGNYVEQICAVGAQCQTHVVTLSGTGESAGVISINGADGVFTFDGDAVDCSGSHCAFNSVKSINGATGEFNFSGSGVSCTGVNCVFDGGGGPGVSSINSTTGAFTFNGPGVTCVSTTCTFTGGTSYNVLNYGAKCDGTTDDTAAIQSAVNAAEAASASSAGAVLFPAGNNCHITSTVLITGNVTLMGETAAKILSTTGGSGVTYSGNSDAFLVQNGSPTGFTFFVNVINLGVFATGSATSLLHFHGINGPSLVASNTFNGGETAAHGVIYDTPGAGLQTIFYNNLVRSFTAQGTAFHAYDNIKVNGNQFFDVNGAGLYLSNVSGEISDNYFELMPTAIEVANDDENNFLVNIHDNRMRNDQSPPLSAPVNTVDQRCILIKSTSNSLPFYGQGSIKNNYCFLSVEDGSGVLNPGIAPYGIDFETISNTFYVNQQWSLDDLAIAGTTTSGVFNDNPNVSITVGLINAVANWTPGSSAPTYIPSVAGSGTYIHPQVTRPPVGGRIGTTAFDWQHVYETYTNGPVTGTLKIALPAGQRWSTSNLMFRIRGFNFTANSSWEIIVGGNNSLTGPQWVFGSLSFIGIAPFSTVRLADDGANNVLLLGTTTTSWFDPTVTVDLLTIDAEGWDSGWSSSFLTSESGIAVTQTMGSPGIITPLVKSGVSSNTDLSGELTLSTATTVSYTFLNTYASHPICGATPEFNPGTNIPWITYTGTTSFTVNFATAVSGGISYVCHGRN